MTPLKVFYVIDNYEGPLGGTENQLFMLVDEMVKAGHDVQLFVFRHTDYTKATANFPCPIHFLGVKSILSFSAIFRLLAFRLRVRRERPHVVHTYFNESAILVPIFCAFLRARVVTSRRDLGYWYTRINRLLLRLSNRLTDVIVCNSSAVARIVVINEGADRQRIRVIYNGVADGAAVGTSSAHGAAVEPSPIRICIVANMRPLKRIEDFIRAAARVSEAIRDCRYLVVGEPSDLRYSAALIELVAQLELCNVIEFCGLVDKPLSVIQDCQIGVLTSESEGFSSAILEYMTAGLPVVCSNVGGNSELVEHDVTGYLYPVGSIEDLSSYLLVLCADRQLRLRMGAAGQRRVTQFSPAKLVRNHVDLYRGLAATIND